MSLAQEVMLACYIIGFFLWVIPWGISYMDDLNHLRRLNDLRDSKVYMRLRLLGSALDDQSMNADIELLRVTLDWKGRAVLATPIWPLWATGLLVYLILDTIDSHHKEAKRLTARRTR
jgi:hypothetical protein